MPIREQKIQRYLFRSLVAGLLIWGCLLGIGAAFFGENSYKPLILVGSVSLFVGIWLLLLTRARRQTER